MTECQPTLFSTVEACSENTPGTTIFDQWCDYDCIGTFSNYIYGGDSVLKYNATNQLSVQQNVTDLFNNYLSTNVITDDTDDPGYSNFQNTLLSMCTNPTLPGICDDFLTGWCEQYTREETINNPTLTSFCGCYVPPNPNYLKFTVTPPGCVGKKCTEQPQCDPLCRRSTTVQKAVQEAGTLITCSQNVCVIDQVAIDIVNSQIGNNVNFTSICPACGGGNAKNCLCVIAGVNVSSTLGNVGIANINEFCGEGSVCLVEDSEGNIISEEKCQGFSQGNIGGPVVYKGPNIGIIIIIIFVLIIAIAIALMLVQK